MTTSSLDPIKEEAEKKLNDVVATVSEKAKDACCSLSESVKQKPLVYLGFAAVVGIALGALLLSRRSD